MKALNAVILSFLLTASAAISAPVAPSFFTETNSSDKLFPDFYEITEVSYLFDEGWNDEIVVRLENNWDLWLHWYDGQFSKCQTLAIIVIEGSKEAPETIEIYACHKDRWTLRALGYAFPGEVSFQCHSLSPEQP